MKSFIFSKIDLNNKKLSKGHKKLVQYISTNYDKAAFMTASKLGEKVGVSESTVVRFATEIGFKGYPELQKELQMAILFITHDLGTVARMCDRVAVMYLGKIVETGTARDIYKNPVHPYTKGLMGSVHKIGSRKLDRLFSIEGTVPLALNLLPGCGFYDRCSTCKDGVCNVSDPALVRVPGDDGMHYAACSILNGGGSGHE